MITRRFFLFILVWLVSVISPGCTQEKKSAGEGIAVFVVLCDNENQGIAPVPAKIGKGDDPDHNLYWGCSDGLPKVFGKSKMWKSQSPEETKDAAIIRTYKAQHIRSGTVLTAFAYRGDEMKRCLEEFEKAVASGHYKLVAFIGHNGLMDTQVAEPPRKSKGNSTDAMVLCCKSQSYFIPRLEKMEARPLLLTRQNMYPGAFILHDALEKYLGGKDLAEIRQAAAKAYAGNQKISVKAATGIFADLSEQGKRE